MKPTSHLFEWEALAIVNYDADFFSAMDFKSTMQEKTEVTCHFFDPVVSTVNGANTHHKMP